MKHLCFAFLTVFLLVSCSKETEEFQSDELSEYFTLEPGKYIRYYLDSTRFINFGQEDTTVRYQAKDVVDDSITDNLGRAAWRVIRYLRDAESTSEADWKPSLTYMIVPTREAVEVVENNLRTLKLKLPTSEGFNWHGNSFLPSSPYEPAYPFSNDEDIQFWDYTYENVGATVNVNDVDYDNTITVTHVADSVNVPIEQPDGLAYKNYWVEQYAKGVGLIYKEVSMWEYQPPNGSNPGYRTGFGVRMTIIDHN